MTRRQLFRTEFRSEYFTFVGRKNYQSKNIAEIEQK